MNQAVTSPITTAMIRASTTGISPTLSTEGWVAPSSSANAVSASRTKGVARPSLSPLSTFRARRTRLGTTGLEHGGRTESRICGCDRSGQQPRACHPEPRQEPPVSRYVASIASGKPMISSLSAIPWIVAQPRELDRRGVVEQDDDQGEFGDDVNRRGVNVDLREREHHHAGHDAEHGRCDVGRAETFGQQRVANTSPAITAIEGPATREV